MKLTKFLVIGILIISTLFLSGCAEDEPLEVVSLHEKESTIVLGFNITLIDANSGYWSRDQTATYSVEHLASGRTTSLVLSRCSDDWKQTFMGYEFKLDRTSHKGAVIRIYEIK